MNDDLIILTWVDSPKYTGNYVVYRSDAPLTPASFSTALRLGDIPSIAQTYSYAPPDSRSYYFGVFALSKEGSPYQVFLPAQNVTADGISIGKAATPAPKPVANSAEGAPGAPSQPFVSDIAAKVKGDAIVITYKASPKSRLVLYRGVASISGAPDLLDATLVAAFTDRNGSFTDYPVPGVDYFYALLGEEDLKAGKILIAPGVNSLTTSVEVPAGAVSSGLSAPPPSRTPPLPYFLLEEGDFGDDSMAEYDGLVPARPVSPETEKAISSLLALTPAIKPLMPPPRNLTEETAAPSGGEDYALSLIVSDRITAKDWPAAVDQLRDYLSLNRSPKAAARAHYYLGEALTYMGLAREAFFEFLSARDSYPTETEPWIEYVLSTLRGSSQG